MNQCLLRTLESCMINQWLNGLEQRDGLRVNGLQCIMSHNRTIKHNGLKYQESMTSSTMNEWPWASEFESTMGLKMVK